MNKILRNTYLCVAIALLIVCQSACSTWNKLNNTEKGAVIGTGTGVAVGGAVGGTPGAIIGGVGGGVGGGVLGHEVDKDEREHRRRY